jgi:hypothetical protein
MIEAVGGGFWGILLIGGPLLLLGVMLFVWLSNRAAVKRRGGEDAALGNTNAVMGSDNARPDLARDEARAKHGESVESRSKHGDGAETRAETRGDFGDVGSSGGGDGGGGGD